MNRTSKIIIAVLSAVILAQWVFIFKTRQAPPGVRKPIQVRVAPQVKKIPVPAVHKGNVAIVLDDWGYNTSNLPIIEEISQPLTLSILPNLAYSQKVAQTLHKKGFEIILHQPMEPFQKTGLEKNTILTTMDGQTIHAILEDSITNLPHAKGINNHMGSRATEDNRTMQIIMTELKKKNLYFLDSYVTSRSVAESEAARSGVAFIKRDIFLDNQPDPEYIRRQIEKLLKTAERRGFAVGIGHDRKSTLEVLRQVLPEAAKNGYRFVFLSELVK
ncbi:MAG: divergent polysaccharide deacetylase family protein [Candidatus Omnitrophica bacterium]|jgi:hypothetical protein|nr:divergent polysaccharide deacetylase family protein [Candidatus Omnitrophota bacterium]